MTSSLLTLASPVRSEARPIERAGFAPTAQSRRAPVAFRDTLSEARRPTAAELGETTPRQTDPPGTGTVADDAAAAEPATDADPAEGAGVAGETAAVGDDARAEVGATTPEGTDRETGDAGPPPALVDGATTVDPVVIGPPAEPGAPAAGPTGATVAPDGLDGRAEEPPRPSAARQAPDVPRPPAGGSATQPAPASATTAPVPGAEQVAAPGAAAEHSTVLSAAPRPDVRRAPADETRPHRGQTTVAAPAAAAPREVARSGAASSTPAPASPQATPDGAAPRDAVPEQPAPRPVGGTTDQQRAAPAEARAAQVDGAVRLEQLTGSAPTVADGAARPSAESRAPLPGQVATTSIAGEGAASARSAQEGEGDPMFGRVVRGMSALMNQRGGIMSMRLHPPELGDLRIRMSIVRGTVNAHFEPSTSQAQSLLDQNVSTLRSALQGQGLTVERLTIQAPPAPQQAAEQGAERHDEQRSGSGGERNGDDREGAQGDGTEQEQGRRSFARNRDEAAVAAG